MKCIRSPKFLDQVKGLHTGMVFTLNEIAPHPPAEVIVHNLNEGIMNEHELDDFIQIHHDGYVRGQNDYIKDISTGK